MRGVPRYVRFSQQQEPCERLRAQHRRSGTPPAVVPGGFTADGPLPARPDKVRSPQTNGVVERYVRHRQVLTPLPHDIATATRGPSSSISSCRLQTPCAPPSPRLQDPALGRVDEAGPSHLEAELGTAGRNWSSPPVL
jgi:hypothetical protein